MCVCVCVCQREREYAENSKTIGIKNMGNIRELGGDGIEGCGFLHSIIIVVHLGYMFLIVRA